MAALRWRLVSTTVHGKILTRYLSTVDKAKPLATRQRVRSFWNRQVTLFPHLIDGGLTVGTVGYGSPHFAAGKHRETSLLSSLQYGCNLVELGEAWKRDDPRIFGEEGYLDQFLYGSWESAELDRIFTESVGANTLGTILEPFIEPHKTDKQDILSREELVFMGRCSLSPGGDVKDSMDQLCEYHFLDHFDFLMVDISSLPCDSLLHDTIVEAMTKLEEQCSEGKMIAYGFSLNVDHISHQLQTLKEILQDGNHMKYPRFSVLGLPAGPFTHIPSIDVLKEHEGFEHVHIIGENVTHQKPNSKSMNPLRFVEAYPSPDATIRRDGSRISTALNRAIFLEKEYTSRFIEGNMTEVVPSNTEEADSEADEVSYPLPFLPRQEDVSWGQLLAMHHDSQIQEPDQWESAKERMILPLLDQALSELSQHKQTKDWAVLYKVTCRELFNAFDEEHNYRRHELACQLNQLIDSQVPSFTTDAFRPGRALSLEARCVCLALSRGADVVFTEDWVQGDLYTSISQGNIPLRKDAVKVTHIPWRK